MTAYATDFYVTPSRLLYRPYVYIYRQHSVAILAACITFSLWALCTGVRIEHSILAGVA